MLETKVGLIFDHSPASIVVDEGKNSKDDGELGNANASGAKSINDGPGITKPSNFRKDQAAN